MNKHKILGKIGYTIFKVINLKKNKTSSTLEKFNISDEYLVVFR